MQRLDALASTALVGQRVDRGRLRRRGYPAPVIDMVMNNIRRAAGRVRAKALWKKVRDTFRTANITRWLVDNSEVGRESNENYRIVGQIGYNKYGRNTEHNLPDRMRNLWGTDWDNWGPGFEFNLRGGRARRAVNRYKPY